MQFSLVLAQSTLPHTWMVWTCKYVDDYIPSGMEV